MGSMPPSGSSSFLFVASPKWCGGAMPFLLERLSSVCGAIKMPQCINRQNHLACRFGCYFLLIQPGLLSAEPPFLRSHAGVRSKVNDGLDVGVLALVFTKSPRCAT